jgi:hypothetical protein
MLAISIYMGVQFLARARPSIHTSLAEEKRSDNIHSHSNVGKEPNTFGILQTMWLSQQHPDRMATFMSHLQELEPAPVPKLNDLRRAGMMEFPFTVGGDATQQDVELEGEPFLKYRKPGKIINTDSVA